MIQKSFIIFFALFSASTSIFSEASEAVFSTLPQSHPGFSSLASNRVSAVAFDSLKTWVATDLGLSFTSNAGKTWKTWTTNEGLSSNKINTFLKRDRSLYLGTSEGLSFSHDNGATWKTSLASLGRINDVFVEGNSILVSTLRGFALSNDLGKTWTIDNNDAGLGSSSTYGVLKNEETLFVAHSNGLSMSKNDGLNWSLFNPIQGTGGGYKTNKIYKVKKNLYLAAYEGLFVSLDNGTSWKNLTTKNSAPVGEVVGFCQSQNSLYLTTPSGPFISQNEGQDWKFLLTSPPSELYNSVSCSENGDAYFSTSDGVRVFSALDKSWKVWKSKVDFFGPTISAVKSTSGKLFVADMGSGLSFSNDLGLNWANIKKAGGLASNYVADVTEDSGTLYAGTFNGLSISKDGGTSWQNLTTANGLASDFVYRIASKGSQLILANSETDEENNSGISLSLDSGKTWKVIRASEGLPSNNISAVYADNEGLFVSTFAGLSGSFDKGNTWKTLTPRRNLGTGNYQTIAFARDNAVWALATYGDGVVISLDQGKSWVSKVSKDGLGSDKVNDIVIKNEAIYAATSAGLSVSFDRGESWKNYTTNQGLGSSFTTRLSLSDDSIYVATPAGLSVAKLSRLK